MIELRGLSKTYHSASEPVQALQDLNLTIAAGEFVAIMGPSGSGKSTLLHLLGLLDTPDSGTYHLFGREVSKLSDNELAELRSQTLGFVFQSFNLLDRASALENVSIPLLYAVPKLDRQLPETLLSSVGLGDRLLHKTNQLSGGQQQRVAIARALVNTPYVILADEPTGNLDSATQEEIMQIFGELNQQGITVVVVTHELEIANYAQRVIKMRDGAIVSDERKKNGKITLGLRKQDLANLTIRKDLQHSLLTLQAHTVQAMRSLLANKIRSLLSMLGILIGVAAVITMLALGSGAKASLEKQLASLGTNLLVLRQGAKRFGGVSYSAGSVTRFSVEDARQIKESVPDVRWVGPRVVGRGLQVTYADRNWNTNVTGATPEYASIHALDAERGRFYTEAEDQERARVALIGATVLKSLFAEGQNPIGETIKINRIAFQVIGVLKERGESSFGDQDDMILIPLTTAMRRLLGKVYVEAIDIEVSESSLLDDVADRVKKLMMVRHHISPTDKDSFTIRNMAEVRNALAETSHTMAVLLAIIASISLLVGGIGIMNIMLVSVVERTREIGLRKALGATRGDILAQFLVEAVLISALGGVLGIVCGGLGAVLLSTFAGWTTALSLDLVILASSFSIVVGILFGIWPAQRAAKLSPIEALRHTGG